MKNIEKIRNMSSAEVAECLVKGCCKSEIRFKCGETGKDCEKCVSEWLDKDADQDNFTLYPCPFCGGEAKIDRGIMNVAFYVKCQKCRCSTFPHLIIEEAVDDWNRRISNE